MNGQRPCQEGFTLIELIIVLVILGLLSTAAIPRFFDLRRDAEAAANRGWVGGLRTSIGIQLAGVMLGKTIGPDPRSSVPAWNRTTVEEFLEGGPAARPSSLEPLGTDQWSGYYNSLSTTAWTLTFSTESRTWEIAGP